MANLISVPVQYNYTDKFGIKDEGTQNSLNIQPVVPLHINEDWNVITRTIVPFLDRSDFPVPGKSESGLGDIVASQFFSPVEPSARPIMPNRLRPVRKAGASAPWSFSCFRSKSMKSILLVVLVCCVAVGCQRHETSSAMAPSSSENTSHERDPSKRVGKWLRPDGGYVLEIRSVMDDGKLDAGYFNPNPINVSQATWRESEELGIVVFIELRDTGYPGATYRLVYQAGQDTLTGAYHQPTHGETFAVEFVRQQKE